MGGLPPHLRHRLLGALVEGVLAHVHQLPEEDVTHLKEASAGGLHQGVQDGADVGLDANLQQLLSFVENHSWTRNQYFRGSSPSLLHITHITI